MQRMSEKPRTQVSLPRGTVLSFRPPTPEECQQWGFTWMAEARRSGRLVGTWPGNRHTFLLK
jgi:hypothetical protein